MFTIQIVKKTKFNYFPILITYNSLTIRINEKAHVKWFVYKLVHIRVNTSKLIKISNETNLIVQPNPTPFNKQVRHVNAFVI